LDVGELGGGGNVSSDDRHHRRVGVEDWDAVVEDKKLAPVAEVEGDAHLIVWQSSCGKGHTAITGEEEGKREIEVLADQRVTNDMGSDKAVHVTDHVIVAHAFAGAHSESGPEVKEVIVESLGYKIVEGDTRLSDQVMHEITGPANPTIGAELVTYQEGDLGDGKSKPCLEEVVARSGDGNGPLLVEACCARGAGQDDRHLGEPG
jgi:hypothetical protein